MYYDHFLAVNWSDFSPTPLNHFSDQIYTKLESRISEFPEKTQFMLPYMKHHDWLTSYATLKGINKALTGMSRRTKFESKMEHAAIALKADYQLFEAEFNEFFPLLYHQTGEELKRLRME